MDNREIRTAGGAVRADADGATGKPAIVGYAAVFGAETDIGGMFRERVLPGAFADSLARGDDVRALINHDANYVLGRSAAGTLRLAEDDTGLRIEIDPPDTQAARDLMVSIARGDVSQMSFGFVAESEQWGDGGGLPVRSLARVRLMDVSVVTWPAYEATSAALRSAAAALARCEALRGARGAAAWRCRAAMGIRQRASLLA